MNKEKQIDEMGNIIAEVGFIQAHEINGDENLADIVAEALYNKGYRKTTFNERFSREYIRETLKEELCQEVRKQTAKEICLKIIKDLPEPIKAKWKEFFNKKYGVEIG